MCQQSDLTQFISTGLERNHKDNQNKLPQNTVPGTEPFSGFIIYKSVICFSEATDICFYILVWFFVGLQRSIEDLAFRYQANKMVDGEESENGDLSHMRNGILYTEFWSLV